MEKTLHDIFSLGSKVIINEKTHIAEEIMFLGSSEQMYSVLNVSDEHNQKTLMGVDIQSNTLFFLSQEQRYLYCESIKLHNKRLSNGSNIKIFNYKSDNCCMNYENTIAKIVSQANVKHFSSKLSVCEKNYSIMWYSLLYNLQGDSLIVAISEEEMAAGLSKHPLYGDVDFLISFYDFDLKYRSTIVRIEKVATCYLLYMHGYSIEVLQSTQGKEAIFKNIVNPFSVIDFVFNNADSGVAGVVYPHSDEKPIHSYIIVGVLKNINIVIEDCVIGNVRIGSQIDTSEEFINAISNIDMDTYTIAWVNVDADSLYAAFSEGKKLLVAATEFLSFLLKNDMYSDWFGTLDSDNKTWDIRSHYPQISLSKVFYIENCISGESLTLTDGNIRIPSAIKLDDNSEYLFDCDWIETFFRNLQAEDKKILRLRHALKWVTESWRTEFPHDKIIYCSMALEFIVNGENGSNIFDEYAEKFGTQKLSKRERRELIEEIYEKAKIENLRGFSDENIEDLNASIKNMICSKLSEPSFNTKLNNLISRLSIPISKDEKELLQRARKIRNDLIHGLSMSTISTLEVKKLSGITSRILIYKLIDTLKKE